MRTSEHERRRASDKRRAAAFKALRLFAVIVLATVVLAVCVGCVSSQPIEIEYKRDAFGVPLPVVNGVEYPLSEEDRKVIAESFLDRYCI